MIKSIDELRNSINCGYINSINTQNNNILPQFIVNNRKDKIKVSTTIIQELKKCDEFYFSVAFVTEDGVMQLLSALQELETKNIKGKILVSQYQNFTSPKALKRLSKFKNIELRVVTVERGNMHSKGYIFKKGDYYSILIGSSNLTANALTNNLEWNLKVNSHKDGYVVKNALYEFNRMFSISTLCDNTWIEQYSKIYITPTKTSTKQVGNVVVNPNEMQKEALKALEDMRAKGANKALVISATGTGKTYLGAFDVKKVAPKKFLFIVHRERIAVAAEATFKKVLGNISTTILGGSRKYDPKANYVFAMIQTLSKNSTYKQFKPEEFDYILVDETHHICASSYVKVINYFKPKFLLGMTATPDRTDSSNPDKDVYKFFDYNIAYEIRLSKAMEMDLIAPFHYFGIKDLTVDNKLVEDYKDFNKLTCDERVKHIIEQSKYYGYSGSRVKGLVFCSSLKESAILCEKFNQYGYRCRELKQGQFEYNENCIARLEQDSYDGGLDYLFAVDILNEGIDIPEVNQVIMLRPTESAIVFIQQLGRGLRKNSSKEFVVVLDFIGNYNKNFFIPVALSGNNSYSKEEIRKFVNNGSNEIFGASTINFDPIAKEHIYKAIDSSAFGDAKLLKELYFNLKKKIGRIPTMTDFSKYESVDIMRIINKFGSYQSFLMKYDKDYTIKFSEAELSFLKHASNSYAVGHRQHELIFLDTIINKSTDIINDFKKAFAIKCGNEKLRKRALKTIVREFNGQFYVNSNKTYIVKVKDHYIATDELQSLLCNINFVNAMKEIINVGFLNYKSKYSQKYKDTDLVLYQQYTRTEVCKLLNWGEDLASTLFGGKYIKNANTYPIFVTYNKSSDVADSINYNDVFISPNKFVWTSTNVPISDKPITEYTKISNILEAQDTNGTMPLFIKKDDLESHFYFMGFVENNEKYTEVKMTESLRALRFNFDMETPVKSDIYSYMTSKIN